MRMSTEILLLHNINISESPCQPFALDSLSWVLSISLFLSRPGRSSVHLQLCEQLSHSAAQSSTSGKRRELGGHSHKVDAAHTDLVILTDWLLDGSSVAGAGGGACGRDMNVHNHDPGNMKTLTSSKTLSRWVLIRSLGNCIEHIRWDHWRLKYTEVQSQQMAFTRSPSLSNNPKILNNYLIFTEYIIGILSVALM